MITTAAAYGTVIKLGDGATSEAFTTIDGVRNLQGPNFQLETIDATHHTSGSNYREVKPSFISGGEISFDLLYDSTDTQHQGLLTDLTGRTRRNFQMVLTDAGAEQYAFAGYVTQMQVGAPIDDMLTMAVVISIDGAITTS
jgi:hypothetical protein